MDMDKYLKRPEVANLLRVSERTVMRYQKKGLRSYMIQNTTRFKLNDVLDFMETHKRGGYK